MESKWDSNFFFNFYFACLIYCLLYQGHIGHKSPAIQISNVLTAFIERLTLLINLFPLENLLTLNLKGVVFHGNLDLDLEEMLYLSCCNVGVDMKYTDFFVSLFCMHDFTHGF